MSDEQWYFVGSEYSKGIKIRKAEVTKESQHCVWERGSRAYKHSMDGRYIKGLAEMKAYAIPLLESKIRAAKNETSSLSNILKDVRNMR